MSDRSWGEARDIDYSLDGRSREEKDVADLQQQIDDIKTDEMREYNKSQAALKRERLRKQLIAMGHTPCR